MNISQSLTRKTRKNETLASDHENPVGHFSLLFDTDKDK